MSVSPLPFAAPGTAMPWRRCLVLVLALHLLVAALFWSWRYKAEPPWVPPPAVMVLMAAAPARPRRNNRRDKGRRRLRLNRRRRRSRCR
ncbi:hypothetical protein [Serratia marcescens]|uniref:hypothetical protein n=1 Tax=Serratia marcescens TaxID=615 RepID=UPI001F5B5124|nr:hypothetical protein [Serratia marcescens]